MRHPPFSASRASRTDSPPRPAGAVQRRRELAISLAVILTWSGGCWPTSTTEPAAGETAGSVTEAQQGPCCVPEGPSEAVVDETPAPGDGRRVIPDVPLRNDRDEPVHFYSDLVKGRLVAINFIFTTCRGVCPPLGANFSALGHHLARTPGREVSLISVSVDPGTDSPERLRDWSAQFHPAPGWTLVTGRKPDTDRLLRGLGVSADDKVNHSRLILIGDEARDRWAWVDGLAPPEVIAAKIAAVAGTPRDTPASRRFSDVRLVDQDGLHRSVYPDLMADKTVVVHFFFSSCRGSCLSMLSTIAQLQAQFGDRLGKDLVLVSISVDPETDTPPRLKQTATAYSARPGWFLLTGTKDELEHALTKFGQTLGPRESHTNVFIIGNDATGLWKKALGVAPPAELIEVVQSVLDDKRPEPDAPAR
jgi:protein SCO1